MVRAQETIFVEEGWGERFFYRSPPRCLLTKHEMKDYVSEL